MSIKNSLKAAGIPLLSAAAACALALCAMKGTAPESSVRLLFAGAAFLLGGWAGWAVTRARVWTTRPERLFLLLFVPLSLAMMAALPVGRVPDEDSHLQRIWLLSEGQLASGSGVTLTEPAGLLDGISDESTTHSLLRTMAGETVSTERVASDAGFNTGVYPPLSYLPQALAVAFVRLFTANRLVLLYAARFGSWLVTLLLLYEAVRLLPAGKYLLVAVTLMPVALQEEMSASVDGMAIGAVALLTAWTLRLRQDGTMPGLRQTAGLTLLCLLTACCKMIYVPFLLLPAAIPAKQWKSKKRKAVSLLTVWGIGLAASALWLGICYRGYVAGQTLEEEKTGVGTILPQLAGMLSHPVSFLLLALKTCAGQAVVWGHTMLGSALSALNLPMPLLFLLAEGLALLAVWFLDRPLDGKALSSPRVLSVCAFALSVLVMLAALYCWWNPYGSGNIEGMQGRYFLPMLLPLLLAFSFRKKNSERLCVWPLLVLFVVSGAFVIRAAALCL